MLDKNSMYIETDIVNEWTFYKTERVCRIESF